MTKNSQGPCSCGYSHGSNPCSSLKVAPAALKAIARMTFAQYKEGLELIENRMQAVGEALGKYPKGAMGLTHEASKDANWFALMRELAALRTARQKHTKGNLSRFKKELQAEAHARRVARGWLKE